MSEKYNIPEPNSLDSMEGVETVDDFSNEDAAPDKYIEDQGKQSAEKLLFDLLYLEEDLGNSEIEESDSSEKLFQYREKYLEKITMGMKEMVKEWHDLIKPKYIVLNETSAIPFGYVFKELWRIAYPDEEVPKFYRIDPRFLSDDMPSEEAELVYNFVKKRFDDTEANTIIFDEAAISGSSLRRVKYGLTGYNNYSISILNSIANSLAEKNEEIKSIRKEEDELNRTFEILGEEIKSKRKDELKRTFEILGEENKSKRKVELEETFEILENNPDLSRKVTEARKLSSTLYRRKEAVMRRIMDKVEQDNPMLSMLKKEKVFLYGGFGSKGLGELQSNSEKNFKIMIENPGEGIKPTKKEDKYGSGGLRGKIKKGAEGKGVLENIGKLKRLGEILGQELKVEIEKK